MAKNYYVILGVDADATPEQIRSAYRREAKRCHPDHSGQDSETFLDVKEAYDVLGDARARRAYDDELARERVAARTIRPEPRRPRRPVPEPLVPSRRSTVPRNPFGESPLDSLLSEFFGDPWAGFDGPLRHDLGATGVDLHVKLRLTLQQAREGGRQRIWIPVSVRCRACMGRGSTGPWICGHCSGRGTLAEERPVELAFAGGLVDGSAHRLWIEQPGMRDLSLVLHVQIDPW
jgi:molecular chaperone DnaJ